MNLQTTLKGEQALAKEVQKIVPLVEEFFSEFDGKRARTNSGESAKLSNVMTLLKMACDKVSKAWVYSHMYSRELGIEIKLRYEVEGSHVEYFSTHLHLGSIDEQLFKYEFKPENYQKDCERVLALNWSGLKQAAATVTKQRESIEKMCKSYPYPFSSELLKLLR